MRIISALTLVTALVAGSQAVAGATSSPTATLVRGRVVQCGFTPAGGGSSRVVPASASRQPVVATIRLTDTHGYSHALRTDEDGQFSLFATTVGRARMEIQAPGYENRVVSFESGMGEIGVQAQMWPSGGYITSNVERARNACLKSTLARLLPPTVDETVVH